MRCQKCPKQATLHITEITGDSQYEELHFCEECAQKFLQSPAESLGSSSAKSLEARPAENDDLVELNSLQCPHCGLRFKDFRATGRLGCPHDYEVFRAPLAPLLQNIHDETQHLGKSPRRAPVGKQLRATLSTLRKQLELAVRQEKYEEAATLRDQIRQVEGST